MGLIASWNEYQEFIGSAIGDTAKIAAHHVPIVQGITNALCTLNRKYPNTIGGRGYSKYWVRSVCVTPLPEPKPDVLPQFTGGQGNGVDYKMRFYELLYNPNDIPPYTPYIRSTQIYTLDDVYTGPMRGWQLFNQSGTLISYSTYKNEGEVVHGRCTLRVYSRGGVTNSYYFSGGTRGFEPVGFVRADEKPDNDGDLPSTKPVDEPFNPNDLCFTVDGKKYCVPQDKIDKDPFCFIGFGVKICIGTDGITIEDIEKTLDDEPFNPEDYDEEDSPCTPATDVSLTDAGLPPKGVETCENKDAKEVEWVLVTVREFKPSRKAILRSPGELSTIFAGYLVWSVKLPNGEYYMDEIPIRKKQNAYKKPDGTTGYAAYANYDAKISIKEYKQKIEPDSTGQTP